MNKQEVIDDIENAIPDFILNNYQRGKEAGLSYALELVEELDEPEKVVLSKEEAEWLERLKKAKSFLNCLYIITRQGWGHDFEFYVHEEKYKLSYRDDNDEDSEQTKNRLVNALIYGYEVEKEKLYTARLKLISRKESSYINKNKATKTLFIDDSLFDEDFKVHFTQAELEEIEVWNNPAFEIEEVEE